MPTLFRFAPVAVASIVVVAFSGQPAQPSRMTIADAVTCPGCVIGQTRVAVIGNSNPPGSIDGPVVGVTVDGRGRFWVLPGEAQLTMVFDASSKYVKTVGRFGRGPGEFTGPGHALLLPGDSMLVFDDQRAVVVGPGLVAARTIQTQRGFNAGVVLRWPDSVILTGVKRPATGTGLDVHLVSFATNTAVFRSSWSSDTVVIKPGMEHTRMIRSSAAADGSFWTYEHLRYRLLHWSRSGRLLSALDRRSDWFPPNPRQNSLGNPTTPPSPMVQGIVDDRDGNIWVIASVPSANWRLGWANAHSDQHGEVSAKQIDDAVMFDTMIEVIDPRAGKVITRLKKAGYVTHILSGPRIVTYVEGPFATPKLEVVALSLTRK